MAERVRDLWSACQRCGKTRRVNYGRKHKDSGLCRDCYYTVWRQGTGPGGRFVQGARNRA